MKIILVLFVFLAAITKVAAVTEIPEDYTISFTLPIDWTTPNHLDLSVSIPKGFRSIQPMQTWKSAPGIEFIPVGEAADDWSEIITVSKQLIGSRVSAFQLAELLKKLLSKAEKSTVLLEQNSNDKKHQTALMILKYVAKGREEVLGLKIFSGPFDCEQVQYTIRLKNGLSESEAVNKILQFFNENLSVIGSEAARAR